MSEETIIKTMQLPGGQPWEWYGELNLVVLSPELDEEGRQRALSEVHDYWRRSCLRVVDGPAVEATHEPRRARTIRDVIAAL